ncbi:MAG: sigma-70 family RNA polymerase sigma factor [Filimonas sp.]|nr:sigma-70 family RNA polymerase sigma factor [Filimonas sp.]
MEKVAKIKAGDEQVFKEVFYDYSQKLYNYLHEKTKSDYFTNEVVQLTFIKLWKSRHLLNEKLKLSTQLFQIAKTTMIDELRKEERYKTKVHALVTEENLFKPVNGYTAIDTYDINNKLQRAIQELPPIRRKVFSLGKLEELSYKEISSELSISVKTVDKHMQLALRNIKPVLKLGVFLGLLATISQLT